MEQKAIIKVQMSCDKCRSDAMKIAAATDGVKSIEIGGDYKDEIAVTGVGIDVADLTSALRRKVGCAVIESVQEVRPEVDKKKEEKKEKEEEKKDPDPSPLQLPYPHCSSYGAPCHPCYSVVVSDEPQPPMCSIM